LYREADLKHPEAVTKSGHALRNIGEKTRVERVREAVPLQGCPREHTALDVADIPVDAPVPYHPKHILEAVFSKGQEEADVTAKL
jgi:hypothetical protein